MVPFPRFTHSQTIFYVSIIRNHGLGSILNIHLSIGYGRWRWSFKDGVYFQLSIAQVCELLNISFFNGFQQVVICRQYIIPNICIHCGFGSLPHILDCPRTINIDNFELAALRILPRLQILQPFQGPYHWLGLLLKSIEPSSRTVQIIIRPTRRLGSCHDTLFQNFHRTIVNQCTKDGRVRWHVLHPSLDIVIVPGESIDQENTRSVTGIFLVCFFVHGNSQ
mmetsp:Transcript_32917/g.69283  ORF Transcript_32917/g.69283 Transcript_32917/m.69283 type:complete len:222 (-) Transcript_32917:659-1324(-)